VASDVTLDSLSCLVLSRPRYEGWQHCGQSVSTVDARPLAEWRIFLCEI